MTLEEKLAQLVGYWLDQDGNVVAPMQGEMAAASALRRTRRGHAERHRPLHPGLRHPSGGRRRARRLALGGAAPPAARDPPRHPRPRPRGVPHRAGRVEGHDLPDAARLGRVVRPARSSHEVGAAIGALDARPRHPPGPRPGARRRSATRAGAGSTSASARTRTSSAPSARPSSGASSRGACTRRSSTSSATPAPRPDATTPRSASVRARWPTCSCRRSRWPSSTAAPAR